MAVDEAFLTSENTLISNNSYTFIMRRWCDCSTSSTLIIKMTHFIRTRQKSVGLCVSLANISSLTQHGFFLKIIKCLFEVHRLLFIVDKGKKKKPKNKQEKQKNVLETSGF